MRPWWPGGRWPNFNYWKKNVAAGINKYEGKDRRRQRLRNHIAKDLRTPKYQPRVVPDKRSKGHEYRHDVYGPYPESDDF